MHTHLYYTDTVTGDAEERRDLAGRGVCVCVGDSCPCAKAGLKRHTIAQVWVRGSWRLNVLYSLERRGAVRGES